MKTREEILKALSKELPNLKRRFNVKKIGVFGSYARGDENSVSDVDLLVEVERPIGLKFFELWDSLEQMLGVKVDLLTIKAVKQKPRLWESIKEDVVYL